MASAAKIEAIVLLWCFIALDCKPICPPGQYFDNVVGRCSPCSDICRHAEIQGTTKECERRCPGSNFAGESVKPVDEPKFTLTTSVAIVLGVALIVIAVIAIVLACNWKKVKPKIYRLLGIQGHLRGVPVADIDNGETSVMVPIGGPPPDDGANGNVPNGTGADREERPMVPPTGDNSVAQESDRGPARYIPTIGATKPNACRLS